MKKIVLFLMAVIMCVSNISYTVSASSNPDLIVTEISLSKMDFEKDDVIQIYVTVKNVGEAFSNAYTNGCAIENCSGGAFAGQTEMVQRPDLQVYPNDEIVYQFPNFKCTGNVISFDVRCNAENSGDEENKSNNIKRFEFKSNKEAVDISIEGLTVTPESYKKGEKANLYVTLENKGNYNINYTNISIKYSIDGYEYTTNKFISLQRNEKKKIKLAEYVPQALTTAVTCSVNYNKAIEEVNYDNNTYSGVAAQYNSSDYIWANTKLGPCGNVPGGIIDDVNGDFYIRTDMAGVYKYNRSFNRFEYILNSSDRYSPGGQAFAVDKKNPDNMYMLIGDGSYGRRGYSQETDLMQSRDGGKTWESIYVPAKLESMTMTELFHNHEAIAVDPNNSNILFYGGNGEGLFVCENILDNVKIWHQAEIEGVSVYEDPNAVIGNVAVDETSLHDGKSMRVYIASYNNGVFSSNDGGKTFKKIPDSPNFIRTMKMDDGILYVTSMDDTNGGVFRYDGIKWEDITPEAKNKPFRCVDISPLDSDLLAACTENKIYYSLDRGKSWKDARENAEVVTSVDWVHHSGTSNLNFVVFDPYDKYGLWTGDWFGVFRTRDVTAKKPVWTETVNGIEELCITHITAPVSGDNELLVTGMDMGFITCDNIFEYPKSRAPLRIYYNGTAADYCKKNPSIVAASTGERWLDGNASFGYSTDSGKTLSDMTDMLPLKENGETEGFGHVVVAADVNEDGYPTILAISKNWRPLKRSLDGGKTWESVNFSVGQAYSFGKVIQLASDFNNKDLFYYFNRDTGEFFVSNNNGASFERTTILPKASTAVMRVFPGNEGYIVLGLDGMGLYLSRDHGKTFDKIENVSKGTSCCLGKRAEDSEYDTIFVYGVVNGVKGIFMSTDLGANWTKITNEQYNGGVTPTAMDGDKKRFGVVYVGTNGRGIYVGMPKEGDFRPVNIEFENVDGEIVRNAEYMVSGFCDSVQKINFEHNGKAVTIDTDSSGKFSEKFILDEGENIFDISVGIGESKTVKQFTVINNPKYVSVETDVDEVVVANNNYVINGKVNCINDSQTIDINGEKAIVDLQNYEFSKEVLLKEGVNDIKITATDSQGNSATKIVYVNYDCVAPEFSVKTEDIIANDPIYYIEGSLNENATVYVNGDSKGDFEKGKIAFPIPLEQGINNIDLKLVDSVQNSINKNLKITYTPNGNGFERDNYRVNVLRGTPEIDGALNDNGWTVDRVVKKNYNGKSDNLAIFGMMYDEENLYIGGEVVDSYVYNTFKPNNSFNCDSIELFFDANCGRTNAYESDDRQLRVDLVGNVYDCTHASIIIPGSECVTKTSANGYSFEMKIPLSYLLLKEGNIKQFNFDIAFNDCDNDSGARDSVLGWANANDMGWRDTTGFGTCIFK